MILATVNRTAKAALTGTLLCRPGMWDAEAEAWARCLPHDTPDLHAARLASMVAEGRASQLDLMDGETRVGLCIYALDCRYPRPEFVIHAAYSPAGFLDLTGELLPKLCEIAREAGCASVRFSTVRPGLIAKAQAHGFQVSEVILRAQLDRLN